MKLRRQTVNLGLVLLLGVSGCTVPGSISEDREVTADPQEMIFPDRFLRLKDTIGWSVQEAFPSQLLLPLMYTDQGAFYDTLLLN